jgi:hypothetical protein
MDMYFPLIGAAMLIAVAAYELGKLVAANPTEDEMLGRIIDLRVQRKIEVLTKDALEKDIEAQANSRLA